MKHITESQRYTIKSLLTQGVKISEIAKTIAKDRTSVYCEIKRNKDQRSGIYYENSAQRKYEKCHKIKPKHIKFTLEVEMRVVKLLKKDYSPE